MADATEGDRDSTWSKLRQRKVVQWGLAYVAVAWGFLQGLEYVSETFQWPHVLRQFALLTLLVGFPIALVIAWYHGDRGEQRVRGTELAIIALLFALGGGVFWWFDRAREEAGPAVEPPARPAATADVRPSIAVLPFENRSRLAEDAFFVDGIHDDILTQLTKIGAMKVIARTSVEQFRDTKLTTKEIGEKLGVTRVLEGGVQRAGGRIRVTAQLIDAVTDAHLWAENFDRELTAENIFAIQSEVATAIAGALNAQLSASELARVTAIPTRNLEAWEAYQLGRQRMVTSASADLAAAEKYFQTAIELDSKFPLPYAGLAETLILQIDWSGIPESTNLPRAEQLARTAMELGPNLAESWTATGLVASRKGLHSRAELEYRKAIALNPNYALAYRRLAHLMWLLGRAEEALIHSKKALEVDPLSTGGIFTHARALSAVGRFDEAADRYRQIIELNPARPNTYRDLAMLNAYARNDFVAAIPLAEKLVELDLDAPYAPCNLSSLYIDLGDSDQAAMVLDRARKRMPRSADVLTCLAWLRLVRGDVAGGERFVREARAIDPEAFGSVELLVEIDRRRGDYASARSRYAQLRPQLLESESLDVVAVNSDYVVDLVYILQMSGETKRATRLLDLLAQVITKMPRLGEDGYGIDDVRIHALRGDKTEALATLREAGKAGWRGPDWRYYRDIDPSLASIRNEPEFKAVFADIERDLARQRAALAAQPKDAPLDLAPVH